MERREKERERNIDMREKHRLVASLMPPTRDLACNPSMCPDWESNQRPLTLLCGKTPNLLSPTIQGGEVFFISSMPEGIFNRSSLPYLSYTIPHPTTIARILYT